MIELRHMRYFVAVAEELHFGRAAQKLYIAQPPLSQQIRHLEQQIGVELFDRSHRRVRLTEPGRVFLDQARKTLAQAEYSIKSAQASAIGETGRIEVGFVSSATFDDIIPSIIRNFRERHPGVVLALHELTSAEQVQALRDGTIHVGFVRPPVGDDTLTLETVLSEPLVAALPSSHPLARAESVNLADLANDSFVMLPRHMNLSLHDQILSLCQDAGFSPRVAQEAIQLQTITSLVAAGIGVSLVPASLQNVRRGGIVYREMPGIAARIDMAAAYRAEEVSPALALFLAVTKETAETASVEE
ncbi:MAG TPA: LysR family transcriptional regulator [Capsulimonadaceae bacterium]|jgi:DNA-binding transcriptional LysR family regulator